MELRQLEYFYNVAKLKNVTRAAEMLNVAQPSVTASIKKLEKELNTQLFIREHKQMKLTEEGQVFFLKAEDILFRIDDTLAEIKDMATERKGTLRIGIPPMIGTYLFPKVFVDFFKEYPDIELKIWEYGSLDTQGMILEGELDMGIVITSEASVELETLGLSHSQVMVCLPENHPQNKADSLSIADLKSEKVIMLKKGFYHRKKMMESYNEANIKPQIVLSSNQLETIKSLVRNNVGISFLMEDVISKEEGIIGIPLHNAVKLEIGLAWRKDRYLSKAGKIFIDFMKSQA